MQYRYWQYLRTEILDDDASLTTQSGLSPTAWSGRLPILILTSEMSIICDPVVCPY